MQSSVHTKAHQVNGVLWFFFLSRYKLRFFQRCWWRFFPHGGIWNGPWLLLRRWRTKQFSRSLEDVSNAKLRPNDERTEDFNIWAIVFFWTHIFLVPYPIRYGADHKWRHAISDSFWHPLPHRHVFITKTFILSSRDPWLPPPLPKTLPSLMDDP